MRASRSTPGELLAVARLPHLPVLDGLRAIAVLIVYIGHVKVLPGFPGGFGVTIFFFLSGFLITTLLRIERAQTGHISLRGFYARRLLRINPPLWLTMLAMLAAVSAGWIAARPTPEGLLAQALFFSNYAWRNDGLPMVLWSLAVEEHFYLVFPLAFALAMRRLGAGGMAAACLMVCIAVLGVRLVNIAALGIIVDNYFWSHTRIDSILAGCILALWQNPVVEPGRVWKPGGTTVLIATGALIATFLVREPLFREGWRYSIQGAALFVLFSAVLQARGLLPAFLNMRVIQMLGLYSYTFYLVHYGMIFLTRNVLPEWGALPQGLLAGALAFVYAAAMHRFVERPLGRMRQRLNRVEDPDPKLG